MKDHTNERLPYWEITLMKDLPDEWHPNEKSQWETIRMEGHLVRDLLDEPTPSDHPDERSSQWKATLIRDLPDEPTLMRNHPDESQKHVYGWLFPWPFFYIPC